MKKTEKKSGYAIYALLPKKDEKYRRRDTKVEPKWLSTGIMLSLNAEIFYVEIIPSKSHTRSYLVEEICFFQIEHQFIYG